MKLLDDVVPHTGETCLFAISADGTRQAHRWINVHDNAALQNTTKRLAQARNNIYFALASFTKLTRTNPTTGEQETIPKRLIETAYRFKAIWLDLDAGAKKYAKNPNKNYPTQQDAYDDLDDWLEACDLPEPSYVVSSGDGLHVYWALDREIGLDQWRRLNAGLVAMAVENQLKLDAGPSKNAAGVLRVPGTVHQSSGKTVTILEDNTSGGLYSYSALAAAFPFDGDLKGSSLGAKPEHLKTAEKVNWDTGNDKSFQKIMDVSLAKPFGGCEQLAICYEDQAHTDEPLWRAALSVAINCRDGAEWIHKISDQYPGYSREKTEEKVQALVDKPYTCASFYDLDAAVCKQCPLYGKLTSPIQLGKEVQVLDVARYNEERRKEREAAAEALAARDLGKPLPSISSRPQNNWEAPKLSNSLADLNTELPELPKGYFFGKDGGVWRTGPKDEAGKTEDILIYKHRVYVIDRVWDKTGTGDSLIVQFETPHDGLRVFAMTFAEMSGDDVLVKKLAANGVVLPFEGERKGLMTFLRLSAREMVNSRQAQTQHQSYGWTEDNKSFVIGNLEYHQGGRVNATLIAEQSASMAGALTPREEAQLQNWRKVVEMYQHEGMEAAQFVMAASLSSPLYKLCAMQGGVMHLYSSGTAKGKTTAAMMALSIWGRPTHDKTGAGLMSVNRDTENAVFAKAAMLGSIPGMIDEITNRSTQNITDLLYSFTQGRQKDRLEGSNNKLRANTGTWESCVFTTGNVSLSDKLGSTGTMREALAARMLELDFASLRSLREVYGEDVPVKQLTDTVMMHDYGTAGRAFLRLLCTDKARVDQVVEETRAQCRGVFQFTQGERYWESMIVCAMAALHIGNALGLWEFNPSKVYDWLLTQVAVSRDDATANANGPEEVFSQFRTDNIGRRIICRTADGQINERDVPHQAVAIREEHHSGQLVVSCRALRNWCDENHYSAKEVTKFLKSMGAKDGLRRDLMAGIDSDNVDRTRDNVIVIPWKFHGEIDGETKSLMEAYDAAQRR